MDEILRLFPIEMRQAIERKVRDRWGILQEIRIRLHKPIELNFGDITEWIYPINPDKNDGMYIINQLSEYSLYRMTDELREGYITVEGGHRVGISGKVNTEGGFVKAVQHITFFNIRIAKQKIGTATRVLPFIYNKKYLNTLVVGPPQTGKTTLIRDLTRSISKGWNQIPATKVGVIDERSEIAASIKGIPQHDLGPRTDVMDACPKAEGMMMMIRSMSPEVLVVDEIGHQRDIDALMESFNAGVSIICTMHGNSLEEIRRRPSLSPLFQQNVIERIVVLSRHQKPIFIKNIFNQKDIDLLKNRGMSLHEMDRSSINPRNNYMDRV